MQHVVQPDDVPVLQLLEQADLSEGGRGDALGGARTQTNIFFFLS